MSKNNKEKLVKEYITCKSDFHYFCSKYIYIELPGGDVNLNPYEPQKKLIDLINNKHYVLVLKSRQIGISTIIQAYACWLTTFYNNAVIGILSKDGPEATHFARSIAGMIDKLPGWMRPKFQKRTEQSFILQNGSKAYAATVNPKAPTKTLRGKSITFLIIDEAAFIDFVDDAWTSMVPALSTNQKQAREGNVPYGTLILSTPNRTVGQGAWFYKRYMNSISGNDIFKSFIIHWKDIPELANDKDWYNTQCQLFDNDSRKIQQELELKFISTEGSFFDEKTIEVLQDNITEPMEKKKLFNGEIWKFANRIDGKYYLIGVDTAPEHGLDKSAVTIWDHETLEQVWEFQGKCPVLDLIKVVKYACISYPGLIIIEDNSYGNQVVEGMRDSEYSHMLYQQKLSKTSVNSKIRTRPGVTTNSKTRPLMIDALYSYISEFPECVKSKRLVLELIGLISKPSGRVEADIGCHDDLVLSTAFCFYVRKYDPPLILSGEKLHDSAFKDILELNDPKTSFTGNQNTQLLEHIKKNMDSNQSNNQQNIIDTFEFLSRE